MERRAFFRALVGGSTGAAAGAAAKPGAAKFKAAMPTCVCGFEMVHYAAWEDAPCATVAGYVISGDRAGAEYWQCEAPGCPQFHIKYAAPTCTLVRADARVVKRVDKELAEQARIAREWREREEREARARKEAHERWLREFGGQFVYQNPVQGNVYRVDIPISGLGRPLRGL